MARAFLLLAAAISAVWSVPANAAKIYVDVTSEDAVGQTFAYEIRERISSSQHHTLVSSPSEAAFKIEIVTLEGDGQTIYSVALTMRNFENEGFFDYFITSWVGKCRRRMTESCAADLVVGVDSEIVPTVRALTEAFASN